MSEYLLLKWGGLKGWNIGENEKAKAALQRYFDDPVSVSAMMQDNTEHQKQALCDVIDAINGDIEEDWGGQMLTKDEAKKYVMEYGQADDEGDASCP